MPQPTAEVPPLPHDEVEGAMNVTICEDKGEEKIVEAEAMLGKQATIAEEPRQMTTNDGANKKEKKRKKKPSMPRRKIGIINFSVKSKPQDLIEEVQRQEPKLTWPQLLHLSPRMHRQWSKMPPKKKGKSVQTIVYNVKEGRKESLDLETSEDEWSTEDSSSTAEVTSSVSDNENEKASLLEAMGVVVTRPITQDGGSIKETLSDEKIEDMLITDLSKEERKEIEVMLQKHSPLFILEYKQIKGVIVVEHQINLKPKSQPIAHRLRRGLQDIRKLLGSLSYIGQMDPNARLGGVQLMWADLPTHCKVDAGFGGVPLWNVATLIVAMFVRDLDGPLPVPFYNRRAGDIAADIDGYEADSDMLQEPLRESSWTLDTSGAAFRSGVEKSEFFARWLIGTFTIVGDAVLDCLAGCGSMATECERLHRHCISIEKNMVVFRSLLFPQQRLPGEVGTVLHYGHFSHSEELERATSLQPLAQPPIPHFYPPPTPQPLGIAQWPYGPSYPPPYTFMRPHSAWPLVMGGRPLLQRPLFAPPPMEPPPPPGQYPPPPPPHL
ncbi:hypothetical protein L7F22_062909 [Adiantum nelumboides]|nr:hypothetical protein [Adiantum nelumboides]